MKRVAVIACITLFLLVSAVCVGYWFLRADSIYAENSATFADIRDKQFNKETFILVIYDPKSVSWKKDKLRFEALARKYGFPLLAVDKNIIGTDGYEIPFYEDTVTPAFYYFEKGQLRLVVEGNQPLEAYMSGIDVVRYVEKNEQNDAD